MEPLNHGQDPWMRNEDLTSIIQEEGGRNDTNLLLEDSLRGKTYLATNESSKLQNSLRRKKKRRREELTNV